MKRTLGSGTLIGIALVLAFLFANAALNFHHTQQMDEDARWVVHTHEVLDLTGDALLMLIDAETGQRGFLVTNNEIYLAPYNKALARWPNLMETLRIKTELDTRQQERIKQLEEMSAKEFNLLKEGIEIKKEMKKKKKADKSLVTAANDAAQQMIAIRKLVDEMRAEEKEYLAERQARTAEAYRTAVTTEVLTTVVGVLVLGAFVWALQRSLRIRERAAAAIREQREWLSTTLSSIGDGVITTDTQGKVTLVNVVAQGLTGWTTEDAQGKPLESVFRIINEQSRARAESPVQRVLQSGAILGLANHTVLIAKDGTEKAIDDSTAPIKNDQGKIIGVVMVFRDVTERRRTEEVIRTGESRLRMALAAARMVIWDWNPALDRIVMSEGFADVLGVPATAKIDGTEKLFELIHPDDLPQHRAILEESVANVEGYVSQYRIIRQDIGATVWLEERGHPIAGATGRTERVIALVMDINDRKHNEEALKDADQKKNEFLAMLAHELRNPLAPIRNALQIMRLNGGTDQSLVPVREMMDRQVGHLVRLVDDLLDVSRITRGSLELRKSRFPISQAVESAVEAARPLVEAAKHELTVSLPPQPLMVDGDLTRLSQVVSNLLSNAVKYTPEGGHIWLTLEREENHAVLCVRDNGMGIPTNMLSHVFEMFTQVDHSGVRTQGGLGIGLTLVRRLVQMHGGTVEAQSGGADKGSEFIVRLPMAADTKASAQVTDSEAGQSASEGPRRRILVVDDNIDSAESLGLLLKLMGHEVCTAHDGQGALDAAMTFRPDVVLLDIGLPGMNGYEVATRMKAIPELSKTQLVAQTGWGQEEDRRRSSKAGFAAHLVKPVDQEALKRLLKG